MKHFVLSALSALWLTLTASAQLTLDDCLRLADANYPLIKKYALVEQTEAINLSDINKGWLPRIGVYGQLTGQNAVPSFPDALSGMLDRLGQKMEGLGHVQYKAGIDISQTVWDGGASKSRRNVERVKAEVNASALDVEMYAMHDRVQSLFFGILLLDRQTEQTKASIELLESNHARLMSMVSNGTAMQADADMVEAQTLSVRQQLAQAESSREAYGKALELYIGERLGGRTLILPSADMPAEMTSMRPELRMYENQIRLNAARADAVNPTLMPRLGFFAQAYYGYPGLNYFESMRNRDMSVNLLAGIKLSWNIDSFYTRKNTLRSYEIATASTEADRDLFLFRSGVETENILEQIDGLRDVMKKDARIVMLRTGVRKAAESQLVNGVIDATALLAKITDETQARLSSLCHEIQLVQKIYQLRHTLNR